jgi:hypothetical protein
MLKRSRLFAILVMLFFVSVTFAGINWKAVWLEAPYNPVHIKTGESRSYTVMGLNGMNTTADLTHSQWLTIVSSDPTILEIDKEKAQFVGKAPGHVEILGPPRRAEANPKGQRPGRSQGSKSCPSAFQSRHSISPSHGEKHDPHV